MSLADSLINDQTIRVRQVAADWKEAVKIGIDCLVKAKKVTWEYYNAILRSVQKNGPYFVLMPEVVLPHARPEEGVLAPGFSLVTLREPIDFGSPENDPISILLSFCAIDATAQVEESLSQVVTLFEDESAIQKMKRATTVEDIEKILRAAATNEDADGKGANGEDAGGENTSGKNTNGEGEGGNTKGKGARKASRSSKG